MSDLASLHFPLATPALWPSTVSLTHRLGWLRTLRHPVAVLQTDPLGWALQSAPFETLWAQTFAGQEAVLSQRLAGLNRGMRFEVSPAVTLVASPMGADFPSCWLLEWLEPLPVAPSDLSNNTHSTDEPADDEPADPDSPEEPLPAQPLTSQQVGSLIQEVTQAVNSSLILDEIFEALGDVLKRHIPYDEASIALLDDTQNGVKLLVKLDADGFADLRNEAHPFTGNDPCLNALLIAPQPKRLPLLQPQESLLSATFDSRALVVPLINKGVMIGAMALNRTLESPNGPFESADEAALQVVADPVALAVENAKFYLQLQAQAGREFLINRLTMAIRQSLRIEQILATAVEELGQVMGVSRCLIQAYATPVSLATPPGQPWNPPPPSTVHSYAYMLPGIAPLDTHYWPSAHSLASLEWAVFRLRQPDPGRPDTLNPFVLDDVADCPAPLVVGDLYNETLSARQLLGANQVSSVAIFPILAQQELVGTITLHQCEQIRTWLPEDLELFGTLAEHLGVALSQARMVVRLEHQNNQLEQALGELQQTQMHLIQTEKMAVLGQFVAGIAHEVNTPLGTIVSNNTTLLSCVERLAAELSPWIQTLRPSPATSQETTAGPTLEAGPSDSGTPIALPVSLQPKRLEAMLQLLRLNRLATTRIDETVKNLRNFVRLDESERKVVNLHEGLESTLLILRSSLPRNLKLIKAFDPQLPEMSCFPGLLNQVFMNLIINAVHATAHRESPRITVSTGPVEVEGTPWIEIAVADNGSGISPENLSRIFDPGFTTKSRGVGTGLGLALCYQIVEKHGGHIAVESVVDEGTTFHIRIPAGSRG